MKSKIVLFLGLFLILVSSNFGFEILNSDNEVQEYFSLTDNLITVVSEVEAVNVSVEYEVSGVGKVKDFPFSICSEEYCSSFSLSSLTESSGGSFSGSSVFNITVLGESKLVYIDLENPTMVLDSIELNSSNQEVEFDFSFSDNSNKLKTAKLYRKYDSSEIFIADVLDVLTYSYDVSESGDYSFLFKLEDEAGNLEEFEYDLSAGDIFEPIINSVFVVLSGSNYEVEFDIEDDVNLTKYEIVQGTLIITEDISGTSFNKILSIPFDEGNILLKVYDLNDNVAQKTISLESIISNTFYDKFSNDKEYKFKSNADECVLTGVDSRDYDSDFSESSNTFSYNLDINRVANYELEFYCTKDNFKEYYSKDFYYDINEPSDFEFEAFANEDGSVSLTWDESFDKEGIVEYRVFRDDEEVYDGSKLKFEDKGAVYPGTYSFFIEAFDEADNEVQTSEIEVTPNKVSVDFVIDLVDSETVKDSSFGFDITTDKNSKVSVTLKSAGQVIDSKVYDNIQQEKLDFLFNLESGINQIIVEIVDEVGNVFEDTYFITYDDSLISASIEVIEPEVVVEVVEEEGSFYSWIWFVFILIILAIFVKIFIFDENKLTFLKKQSKSKSKNKKFPLLSVERVKDHNLEKDFNRIKKQRIKKQFDAKREIERKHNLEKRGRTDFEKKKLEDLSKRKEVSIPFNKREVTKKKIEKIKKDPSYDENLKPSKEEVQRVKKSNFFLRESKSEKIRDELGEYLQKVKSTPSWNSTRDYVDSPVVVEPVVENKSEVKKDKSSLEDKVQEKKSFMFFRKKENISNGISSLVESSSEDKTKVWNGKIDLDDYLNKTIKKRGKKNSYFAERSVESDLRNRD
ncbi:MAG: hypothetical protein PF569_09755 [Candidatus Woesearchaeota archaeon]|jgi:hypothetical protein|nr:hypothetical protein [Candidatus Woesearchaeota archaeon]